MDPQNTRKMEYGSGRTPMVLHKDVAAIKFYWISLSKMRMLSDYIVPLILAVYYKWVRRQKYLLEKLKDAASLNILAGEGSDEGELECRVECQVLHDPGEAAADVIFIHGIKGALEKTWTQGRWRQAQPSPLHPPHTPQRKRRRVEEEERVEEESEGVKDEEGWSRCWPRDWLPRDCPDARVIAVNYPTDPNLWRLRFLNSHQKWVRMEERSKVMMEGLVDAGVGERPIVWVGHSKGGLYIKQILVNACEADEDNPYKRLADQTRGILFYSVPHRGSALASISLPGILTPSIELMEVQKDCEELLTLREKFTSLLQNELLKPHIKSFIETRLTLMACVYLRIVSLESADAEYGELYGVPLDHRNICKPKNRQCFLYRELVDLIQVFTEGDEAEI